MRLDELKADPLDGIYVAARFTPETIIQIDAFQAEHAIPNPIAPSDLHTTIVHSTKPIFWRPESEIGQDARASGFAVWETRDDKRCLVMLLDSDYLHQRWQVSQDRGAVYDFDEYRPHISLSYDVGEDFAVDHLPVPAFPIGLDHEYAKPLED